MIDLMLPDQGQAEAFAVMLNVGMPADAAIRYFLAENEDWTPESVRAQADKWAHHRLVRLAIRKLMGKSFEEMSPEERIQYALNKHYSELAYLLHSRNYSTLEGADKVKADTARGVLETKLAGLAGQLDPLTNFWNDLRNGKIPSLSAGTGGQKAPPLTLPVPPKES